MNCCIWNYLRSQIWEDIDKSINCCIWNYLRSQIWEDIDKSNASYRDMDFKSYICDRGQNTSESHSTNIIILRNTNARNQTADPDDADISDPLEIDLSDPSDTDYRYDPFADTSDISDPLEIDLSDPSDTDYPYYIDGSDISDPLEIDLSDPSDTDYPYYIDGSDISDPLEIDLSDLSDTEEDLYGIYDLDEIYYLDGSDRSDPLETLETLETLDPDYINDPDGSDRSDPLETLETSDLDEIYYPDGSDRSDPLETLETSDPDYINDPDGSDRSDPLEISDTSDTYICQKDSDDNSKMDMLAKMNQYSHLWVLCETCSSLNFKQFLVAKLSICEYCGEHLKMRSSDRIEILIDPGTWNPMDEDMVSLDPIKFDSIEKIPILQWDPIAFDLIFVDPPEEEEEEEDQPYIDRLDSYQEKTGLPEAVQTGIGQLNGIPLAIAVMDSEFIAGSMGSVVGEKITRLIEYATNQLLPLIIVCASGGARMQEGSLSLMQMAKISSALYNYQINKKLFYVAILTSPTTGGVTASFAMLGDIVIAEPNATIAFAGKRVIEQLLNVEVPEGSQSADLLFDKGVLDSVVPRHFLKQFLTELFQFHGFVPLTKNLED
ncbi:unnamed protein product [Lathyrus sativus]|nr:unnamed protein product [Lathyrus sativus]